MLIWQTINTQDRKHMFFLYSAQHIKHLSSLIKEWLCECDLSDGRF
jgi:hypothetical protein